ncbi:MFS transporter [Archangium violaceum]|uniref:MFS transporter n=1 Tax=Archangium violaceum TaxID=83451 RepID=UPI0036D98AED
MRTPYGSLLLVGLGGLFAGVTGPLLSAFVPLLVRDALGEQRTAIGAVMAIDNVLLLLLVPWAGAASDRASAHGRGRLPIVLSGLLLAAVGMALFPFSARFGLFGLVGAIVVLYSGINLQRSPFQALMVDLVPSRFRSLANGSVTFQMCVGAIVFLMLGRMLGMRLAFLIAAGAVLAIAGAFALGLREPTVSESSAAEATFRSLLEAARSAARGVVPGMRAIFAASLLLQLTFQTFTTWYALHGTKRFGVRPEDVSLGFIAWAVGGVIGALPAGVIGVRIGRRNAMLVGFGLMAVCLLALDRVTQASQAVPLLALASACWTLPTVNAYPLFVEPIPRQRRGVLAALFLLCMALSGAIGDPLNGALFDLFGGYRPLFWMMAGYTALAFVAVLFVPRGAGEAETGPDSAPSSTATARSGSAVTGRVRC